MIDFNAYRPLIRRIAIAGGGIAAFLALGLISLPIGSGPVLSLLKEIIGREIGPVDQIEGQASLRLLPHPMLDVSALNISFQNQIKLQSPDVSFGLRLFSLLSGRYEPVSMHVESPHVTVPSELVPNDPDHLGAALAIGLSPSNGKTEKIQHRQIETITVSAGRLSFTENDTPKSEATDIRLAVYFYTDGSNNLSGSGLWGKKDVSFSLNLGSANPTLEGARSLTLDVNALSSNLRLKGEAFRGGIAQFDGRITSDIARLDKMGDWLDLSPPVPFATSLTIDGKAHLTPLALAISEAQIKLGPVQMTGGVSFDISGPRPLITGTLSAGDMDVTNFLTPIWPKQADSAGWKITPISPELTPQQDFDIRLSAERINLGIVRISNVALAIMAKDRTLDITLASARLFQGSAKGKVTVQPDRTGFAVTSHGNFETIEIGQASLALLDLKKMDGTVTGTYTLTASGSSLDQWMKTLSGQADGMIANGSLAGVNISSILKRIETRPLSAIRDMRGGKTDFETMRLSANFAEGTATLTEAEMALQPNRMKLVGKVDLGERKLNLLGEAVGPPPVNGAEPAVLAYSLTGTFDDPVVTPDISRILKRSSATPATAD
jgi:AsmA protein